MEDLKNLLFGLTPAEFWALNYIILLAKEQGSNRVILPRPGEDQRAEKIYSRSRLKRLIKSLKAKRHLTHLIIPTSKNRQIEIYLPAKLLNAYTHPNRDLRASHAPKQGGSAPPTHPKQTLSASTHANKSIITEPWTKSASPKLSSSLLEIRKLIELKQGGLRGEIKKLSDQEAENLKRQTEAIIGREIRGKQSPKAKLYAAIRFMQSDETIKKPGAWLATVARLFEQETARAEKQPRQHKTEPESLRNIFGALK